MDSVHFTNLVYFVFSISGVFNHILFSFLLLDIITKIPLLGGVTKAISQNYKQLLSTTLLLFVVIYIYSFVAFQLFRDDYINDTTPDEDPDFNNYCDSLYACFLTTLNNGVRMGGGIGEALK